MSQQISSFDVERVEHLGEPFGIIYPLIQQPLRHAFAGVSDDIDRVNALTGAEFGDVGEPDG